MDTVAISSAFGGMDLAAIASALGGLGGVAALAMVIVVWSRNSRSATNEDARLGLDALRDGLKAAVDMADKLTIKLAVLESQASLVLSENNRWRIMHGELPAVSLEKFTPLDEDRLIDAMHRLRRTEKPNDQKTT